jgi:hypothetical protein
MEQEALENSAIAYFPLFVVNSVRCNVQIVSEPVLSQDSAQGLKQPHDGLIFLPDFKTHTLVFNTGFFGS